MKNIPLVIAGLILFLNGIYELVKPFLVEGSSSEAVVVSLITGLVIIYLGLYGIPKRK